MEREFFTADVESIEGIGSVGAVFEQVFFALGKKLADDTRLLLAAVGDALGTENTLTVFCADLYGVLNGSGVFGVS